MRRCVLSLAMVLVSAAAASATTYVIRPDGSGDFPTIQAAIDAVSDSATIELADGIFLGAGNRDLDFLGKRIVLRSQGGLADSCIIDCAETSGRDSGVARRGFYFQHNEGPDCIVEAVTVRNGSATGD